MDLDRTLQATERWLLEHAPQTHRTLRPGANPDILAALEHTLGVRLVPELVQLLTWHDGAMPTATGWQLWPGHRFYGSEDIQAGWTVKREVSVEGPPEHWNDQWIPITDDGTGNYLVLDHTTADTRGTVFFLDMVDGRYPFDLSWPNLHILIDQLTNAILNTTPLNDALPIIEDGTLHWQHR